MNRFLPGFEEMATSFAPLIKSQMKALNIYKEYDTFYQIGLIGLWEAYTRFDSTKGEFASFAYPYIRGNLLTHLREERKYTEHCILQGEQFDEKETQQEPLEKELIALYVEGLSERQILWVNEAILKGKKQKQIAAEQGVSTITVKTWRKEAIKRMQKNATKMN